MVLPRLCGTTQCRNSRINDEFHVYLFFVNRKNPRTLPCTPAAWSFFFMFFKCIFLDLIVRSGRFFSRFRRSANTLPKHKDKRCRCPLCLRNNALLNLGAVYISLRDLAGFCIFLLIEFLIPESDEEESD